MARHKKQDEREEVYNVPVDIENECEPEETVAVDVDLVLSEIENLKEQLDVQKQLTQEENNRYLRAMADFANFRRRQEEEFARHIEYANQDLILKLLPVIDNFERAIQAAEDSHSFESLADGVKLILKQICDILEKEGIEPIEAIGQEFDPMKHDAVMRVVTDEQPDNTVVQEVQKGYKLKDRVIRPSRVAVSTSE